MLLNWRLQLRPVRDLLTAQRPAFGRGSPLPFLRQRRLLLRPQRRCHTGEKPR